MSAAAVLAKRAQASRRWLLDCVFPLWSTAGFDARTAQFVEQLTLEGEPLPEVPRRTLVQARQIYVFVAAGRLGWDGPWRDVAGAAADALLARGRTGDGDWVFAFDADGRTADARRDLYTQAFVIFGLAHAGAALSRGDLLDAARATCSRLERDWAHPAGGFVEGEIEPLRRQNPHMHLFEAYLALHAAGGEPGDLVRAERMVDLFTDKLLSRAPLGLLELFEDDWTPAEPVEVWPGHHYEWAWLLDDLAKAGGRDRRAEAAALARRADEIGVGPHGCLVDAVGLDGTPRAATARLWPQAERLKARAGGSVPAGPERVLEALDALELYFEAPRAGLWRDRMLAGGGWAEGPALASSAYHIVGALERLIARAADLQAAAP